MAKAPKSAQAVELFQIDSSGDTLLRPRNEDRNEASARLPKGYQRIPRPLTSTQILAQRASNQPAITSKVTTPKVQITKKQQQKQQNQRSDVLRPEVKRRLAAIARRDRSDSSLASIQPEGQTTKSHELSTAVKNSGTYNLWSEPLPSSSSYPRLEQDNPAPPPIPTPDPGASYNPSYTDHQSLLAKAHDDAQKYEEKAAAIRAKVPNTGVDKVKELWQTVQVDVGKEEEENDNGAVAGGEDDEEHASPRRIIKQRRKTRKERLRRRRNIQLEAQSRFSRKLVANQSKSIHSLPTLISSMSKQSSERAKRKAERESLRKAKAAQDGLATKYSGPARVPAVPIDFTLGEDLSEDLRTIKVQGNLFRDWERSAMRRGVLPARRNINAPLRSSKSLKGRRTKEVEKYAWKHFDK